MIDVDDYLWETVFMLKVVYDHNPGAPILRNYKTTVMDGDYAYEIAESAIDEFFAHTCRDYNDEEDLSIYIFSDPLITEFWKLCDKYEEKLRLNPKENKYRTEMDRDLDSALYIPDYSYDARWFMDTRNEGGCRLELLCYCEFCGYFWIPEALSEAYDAFVFHTNRIKKAIADLERAEPVELSIKAHQKEAA